MNQPYRELITTFPLFEGFTADGAGMILATGEVRDCAAGTILLKEGDEATSVLLVLSGRLEVFVSRGDRQLVLTQAGPGTIIGELAVLCGLVRSASVRTLGPATVLEWTDSGFRKLLLGYTSLSRRVFNQALRGLIEKERSLIDSVVAATATGESSTAAR
jgi:CRP-like cAMP-binding protein